MKAERSDVGAVTVLRLEGELADGGVSDLRDVLYDCLAEGRHQLVLNLANVRFTSYMAVGILVERLRKVRRMGGDIKLSGLNLHGERLFRMVGISSLFEAYDSEARAVRVFQEAA